VTGPRRRTGRRPGAEDTRGRILAAAREAFAARGFERTSIRAVAAAVGVDPALVHHYFGTKQRLFVAASQFPVDVHALVPSIMAGPRDGLGERFVRVVVGLWDRAEVRPLVAGILRSATTDDVAAGMLRAIITEGPMRAMADALNTPDAAARASLAGSQLVGMALARYVVRLEPIASMTPAELGAAIGPTIERYLVGDVALAPVSPHL
jgi:AcrR family transcriptional regulator